MYLDSEHTENLKIYFEVMGSIYQSIKKVSGCRIIIDSSKTPQFGLLLNQMPLIDVTFVHLVRDSRAVAYSLQRRKRSPEFYKKEVYMAKYGAFKSSVIWEINNTLAGLLKYVNRKYIFLTYEDLVKQPRLLLSNLVQQLDTVGG